MRQVCSLAIVILLGSSLFATVRTVSNSPSTLAQYNTIQAAIDASTSGDTVYIHGSPNVYAGFTIADKRLVILGPGWRPDKVFPHQAQINGTVAIGGTTGDPLTNPSNNTEIQGLTFLTTIQTYISHGNDHPNGLKFIRNEFSSLTLYLHETGLYKDYVFEGNTFYNSQVYFNGSGNYQSFLFQNNIFYHTGGQNIYDLTNGNNSVIFDHNLWYGPSNTPVVCFAGTCRFLIITNNIFIRRKAATNNSFSVFNNNITWNAGTNNPWEVNSNSDGGGNVVNIDPAMVDQAAVNAGTYNPLLNFTIAAGQANNSGSDGKDMGLLFDASGSLNWTNSRNSRLPRIYSMNIANPTIPVNGSLNVTVEGRKSN